jgi:nuclear pore complex protein Nup155
MAPHWLRSADPSCLLPLAQWPGLLRTLSPTLFDLPSMVQDKYRACQAMCFCGLFPGIKRAWASVDNSLFMWRYDKR